MNDQALAPGCQVALASSGLAATVETFLGGGGQGEVYRVGLGPRHLALKWFFPNAATTEQRVALETLVRKGPPNSRFLWPMELATIAGLASYGYIMPLREERYKGIVDMMKRRVEPTFQALARAGLDLADSYLQLHSRGLCYRDISFGNVFFDPDSGEILICDNDNVAINGESLAGVLGTPRFMAPEVVKGEALPSTQTDLYSLAVLLFYMFMVHHPLEGAKEAAIKCLDMPAMTRLYGTEPVFIYDPDDASNRPLPGLHDNALAFWPIYPQFLRDLFVRSFTAGLRDPRDGRVRESEWRAALARLRDAVFYCSGCTAENFYDVDALKASGGVPPACWACGQVPRMPARLRVGDGVVMLNHDTRLFPHHVIENRLYDYSQAQAEVARHPADPNKWGLRNLSEASWTVLDTDGGREVPPGRTVTLAVGTRIRFGKTEGEVRL